MLLPCHRTALPSCMLRRCPHIRRKCAARNGLTACVGRRRHMPSSLHRHLESTARPHSTTTPADLVLLLYYNPFRFSPPVRTCLRPALSINYLDQQRRGPVRDRPSAAGQTPSDSQETHQQLLAGDTKRSAAERVIEVGAEAYKQRIPAGHAESRAPLSTSCGGATRRNVRHGAQQADQHLNEKYYSIKSSPVWWGV